jgi:hypothetical protein
MPILLKAADTDKWFNPEAIDVISPLSGNLGNESCEIRFRSGQSIPVAMKAEQFADYVNKQTNR